MEEKASHLAFSYCFLCVAKSSAPKNKTTCAYLHFCKKKRGKLQRKHLELSPNAVTAKLWEEVANHGQSSEGKTHITNGDTPLISNYCR